jgi:uncharacterized protein YecE (DUF72 family)
LAQFQVVEEKLLPAIYVGTAGWTVPGAYAGDFPGDGTHLERYARRFSCVEINSSFYKPHRPATYERWAASVPDDFRFAVKVPKEITHGLKLIDTALPLERFLSEAGSLKAKLGPLLVQLPPSLDFKAAIAEAFFACLRERFTGDVVCEPRHATWFSREAEEVLTTFRIARVAADPAPVPEAMHPGGWPGLVYYRLHGSPRTYYSAYDDATLTTLAQNLCSRLPSVPVWCIFDNTASGSATGNALHLTQMCNVSVRHVDHNGDP